VKPREVKARKTFEIGGKRIALGSQRTIDLTISETYSGHPVVMPVHVVRAAEPGPVVCVTASVHGDEINGMGVVRELILNPGYKLSKGTVVLVPVVNVLGFERFSRYMPDRRDLNRSFPGSGGGSLTARVASAIFEQVIRRCDYCIDLHSAAVRRTNFPNVRADLKNPDAKMLAEAFGTELVIHSEGPEGSLRRAACEAGVPTIILEAGEVWKIEPGVVEVGVRGIRNVLIALGMLKGRRRNARYQAVVRDTTWVRAVHGGVMRFHVSPGDVVAEGQPLATNTDLVGREKNLLLSSASGIVLGMTTLPAVKPGDPVCHIARLSDDQIAAVKASIDQSPSGKLRDHLASNVSVVEHEESPDSAI
jgi:uncharacterized protein